MTPFDPELHARALMPREWLLRAEQLHLALHLQTNSVSAALWESTCVWKESFSLATSGTDDVAAAVQFVRERNWVEKMYRRVTISFDTPNCTLVPQSFEIQGKQGELLWFNLPRPDAPISTFGLDEVGATAIYSPDPALHSLTRVWPHARLLPTLALLIRQAFTPKINGSFIQMYLTEGRLWLVAVVQGKLTLANHFSAQSTEDSLFHLANACMQHGLDMNSTPVVLHGHISPELLSLVSQYCANAKAAETGFPLDIHPLCA